MDKGIVQTVVEIPFLINMGWSFFFTILVMVAVSLQGPKINPKAFVIDKEMNKLKPGTIALIVITLLILTVLYAKFW
jgi:solute:Na+ symporter, SSS family